MIRCSNLTTTLLAAVCHVGAKIEELVRSLAVAPLVVEPTELPPAPSRPRKKANKSA